jgi:DNA-directed RNA polymerase beta' subunit
MLENKIESIALLQHYINQEIKTKIEAEAESYVKEKYKDIKLAKEEVQKQKEMYYDRHINEQTKIALLTNKIISEAYDKDMFNFLTIQPDTVKVMSEGVLVELPRYYNLALDGALTAEFSCEAYYNIMSIKFEQEKLFAQCIKIDGVALDDNEIKLYQDGLNEFKLASTKYTSIAYIQEIFLAIMFYYGSLAKIIQKKTRMI